MDKKFDLIIFDLIIFDLDGTLWETTDITFESTNEIVKMYNSDYKVSRETVMKTMGCSYEQAVKNYFPDLKEEERFKLFDKIQENLLKKITNIGGNVYKNLEKVLLELKSTYKLAIVSNCVDGYIEAFFNSSGLEKYFDDYLPAGKYRIEKGEAIKKVIERNNSKCAIYIGDTDKDYKASVTAGIPFIHAKYGFQKDLKSDYSILDITELPKILKRIE